MSRGGSYRVAVIGGGPAGSTVATLLAEAGADVVLFHDDRRPEIVVGESLVPAVVTTLRRLGVEDEVRALGAFKPGAAFKWRQGLAVRFDFRRYPHRMPPYAYNVPRPAFDRLLLARAVRAGARHLPGRAKLEAGPRGGAEVVLDATTLDATGWQVAPDLIVDATGRARTIARLLDIPARVGPRDDVAHFAHFTGHTWSEIPGLVVISDLPGGWSWQIPLRDRLSVGVVLDRGVAAHLGTTPEARLTGAIATSPALSATLAAAERVSGVATYGNYQLITERGTGPGWVAIGDAFGFVDPMLSPGMMVALRSAEWLADALAPSVRAACSGRPAPNVTQPLARYTADVVGLLEAWNELVEYLYDGRMLALVRSGEEAMGSRTDPLTRLARNLIDENVALLATGMRTTSPYRRGFLRWLSRHGTRVSPEVFAIR